MLDVHHRTQLFIGWDGVSQTSCPSWPWPAILLISVSWVAGITYVSHPASPNIIPDCSLLTHVFKNPSVSQAKQGVAEIAPGVTSLESALSTQYSAKPQALIGRTAYGKDRVCGFLWDPAGSSSGVAWRPGHATSLAEPQCGAQKPMSSMLLGSLQPGCTAGSITSNTGVSRR
jgi:hypothetical protein